MAWTSFSWTDANGATTELLDQANGVSVLLAGASGLNAPPVDNFSASLVALDGSLLVKRRRPERMFVLPLLIESTNLQAKVRTITAALQGPGTLTLSDGIDSRTLLDVYYTDGLGGEYDPESAIPDRWQKFPVLMTALDPWWYGESQTVTLAFGAETPFDDASAFDAASAFDGASSTPITVGGDGDAPALPSFTLTGPFDTLVVGIAGGQQFEIAEALAGGDVVTVSTERGNRGPRLNGGPIDWSLLTPESRLFDLSVGSMTIFTRSTGSTGSSGAEMTFRQRWLTP